MKRAIAIAFAAVLLSGCASIGQVGGAANDEARDTAEFVLCKGISVGSWLRAYGTDAKRAEAWRALCGSTVQSTPSK